MILGTDKTAVVSDEQEAAIRTLTFLGYTYHGAEQWKPPLGKTPEPVAYLAWRDVPVEQVQRHSVGAGV